MARYDLSRLPERCRNSFRVSERTGCWNWIGTILNTGYGSFRYKLRRMGKTHQPSAHRFCYGLLVGPIPKGLTLDHLCRNRRCVNPEHLEPVTLRENLRRGVGFAGRNARKVRCKRGHPFSGDNLRINALGERHCRECLRIKAWLWLRRSESPGTDWRWEDVPPRSVTSRTSRRRQKAKRAAS